jgi:hypothetical protein
MRLIFLVFAAILTSKLPQMRRCGSLSQAFRNEFVICDAP